MTDSPQPPGADPFGGGPLSPPPPAGRARQIIAGAVLIIVGSALALPAGLCTGIAGFGLIAGSTKGIDVGVVAAFMTALGGGLIWAGCSLSTQDHHPGKLFSSVIAVLILIALLFVMWLNTAFR